MNNPICLGVSIWEISKIAMYECMYDYETPKYDLKRAKLCYMDTDSFIFHINTEYLYKYIATKL